MRAVFFEVSVPRVLVTQALGRVWSGAYFARTAPVRLGEVEPVLAGPRFVEVENQACGVCASDLHLVHGDVDPRTHAAALPRAGRVYLGHEVLGTVRRVGPAVTSLRPGDRVVMQSRFLGPTCHSQELEPACAACARGDYCVCERCGARRGPEGIGGGWSDGYACHESEVWRAPDDLPDDAAVLLEPLACGVRAALRALPPPGGRALVIGCGIIGLATLQALRALAPEARVCAVARHPQQRRAAERFGAELVDGDWLEATARLTGAELFHGYFGNRTLIGGFDVVYDCVATADTLGRALRLARPGGTLVVVGVHLARLALDLSPLLFEELDVRGALAHGGETWQGERLSTFDLTARLLRAGQLDTEGLITHRFPLGRWQDAIRAASDKRSGAIKVVLECGRG
ncbi:MAG: zinc-binding dehydrogenase [Polyangiaceae bacterium]|nr:zinc-binding dehydrogenase [Polyangiaceae bacterium]